MTTESINNTSAVPRKASEVLLELEKKVDDLTAITRLYELNSRLILTTVNRIFGAVSLLTNSLGLTDSQKQQFQESISQLQPIVSTVVNVPIPEGTPIDVESDFPGKRRNGRIETVANITTVEDKISTKLDRKVPVTQRIQDTNKRDIFMADIQIFSTNKELVAKSKTSAMGKYQVQLIPGKYTVKIAKVDPTTKNKIEVTQDINVNDSDTTLVLPTFYVQR